MGKENVSNLFGPKTSKDNYLVSKNTSKLNSIIQFTLLLPWFKKMHVWNEDTFEYTINQVISLYASSIVLHFLALIPNQTWICFTCLILILLASCMWRRACFCLEFWKFWLASLAIIIFPDFFGSSGRRILIDFREVPLKPKTVTRQF